jgi:hypothetical protein
LQHGSCEVDDQSIRRTRQHLLDGHSVRMTTTAPTGQRGHALEMMNEPTFFFASPRKLPDPASVLGRVVVLDIAFAADVGGKVSYEQVTVPFLAGLGDRLAMWVDHHDHPEHGRYAHDDRFLLVTKAEAGACPELIHPELVSRVGPVDSILAHLDLDGIMAAAKWSLGGHPPYPEADGDARAVDTRTAEPSRLGRVMDQALRAGFRDESLRFRILSFLRRGCDRRSEDWAVIREASDTYERMARRTREAAEGYQIIGRVALIRIPPGSKDLDKTDLLLLGQERAEVAVVQQSGMITVAAPFDSGFDFPVMLGIGGGMPTRASAPQDRLERLLEAVNAGDRTATEPEAANAGDDDLR